MDINIEELIKLLPEGYQQACYETKAIERKRTVQTPEELLVMCLYYIYGSSLMETSQLAKMNGTGKMSDVAFMKRFTKSNGWFQWITKNIKPGDMCHYQKPGILQEYNVTATDASDVYTKGAVKQAWHLHYALDLFSLNCQQYKITDEKTGETLKNFEIRKNDLILADRAYATITGMEYCLENGGDFILRIRNKAFNLYDPKGEQVLLTDWLETLDGSACGKLFYYRDSHKNYKPVRICALPKTEEEIKKEEKRLKRKESKKQIKISDDTKFSHRYMFVATSLPETFTAEDILSIYRLRWQVEMVFKRYKSILGAGSVPVKTKEATEAWINGKMMLALLIEKFIGSVDFSPSGKSRKKQEHMERNQTGISVNFYSGHSKN